MQHTCWNVRPAPDRSPRNTPIPEHAFDADRRHFNRFNALAQLADRNRREEQRDALLRSIPKEPTNTRVGVSALSRLLMTSVSTRYIRPSRPPVGLAALEVTIFAGVRLGAQAARTHGIAGHLPLNCGTLPTAESGWTSHQDRGLVRTN